MEQNDKRKDGLIRKEAENKIPVSELEKNRHAKTIHAYYFSCFFL